MSTYCVSCPVLGSLHVFSSLNLITTVSLLETAFQGNRWYTVAASVQTCHHSWKKASHQIFYYLCVGHECQLHKEPHLGFIESCRGYSLCSCFLRESTFYFTLILYVRKIEAGFFVGTFILPYGACSQRCRLLITLFHFLPLK